MFIAGCISSFINYQLSFLKVSEKDIYEQSKWFDVHFGLIAAMLDFRARFYFGKTDLAIALFVFQNELHGHKKHELY